MESVFIGLRRARNRERRVVEKLSPHPIGDGKDSRQDVRITNHLPGINVGAGGNRANYDSDLCIPAIGGR